MKKIIFILIFTIKLFSLDYPDTVFYDGNNKYVINSVWNTQGTMSCSSDQLGLKYYNGDQLQVYVNAGVVPNTQSNPQCYVHGAFFHVVSSCPSGLVYNNQGSCVNPLPSTCTWATTPPWYDSLRVQSECNNYKKGARSDLTSDDMYLFNFSWCSVDSTCYAKRYYCPAGQNYDYVTATCKAPTKPAPANYCPSGFYPTAVKHVSSCSGGECYEGCGQDWICKNDPKIIIHREFSCGAGPVDDSPPDTNPPIYDPDTAPPAKPYGDGVKACKAKQEMAQIMCAPPSVLSFSCDPTTGAVSKSECKDPIIPPKDEPTTGDSTKGATTEDIKKLGNTLPTSIKDALKDFFTDGSMSHLESIKGFLQADTILQADTNDKLDAISASADGSLILQSDTNTKLDSSNSKLDSIDKSLKDGKTNEPFTGFTDNNDLKDADEESRKGVFDGISDFTDKIVSDATSIGTQYDNAKTQISNGFGTVHLPVGGCVDTSFNIPGSGVSNTIPLSKIPSVISPYSPIFALLVYLTVMFFTFKFLFLYFIARSK